MRIRATCHNCDRDFLVVQLYRADAWHADKCPHCSAHLGVVNIRPLALTADHSIDALVDALDQIAARHPAFTLNTESVRGRVDESVRAVNQPREKRLPAAA